MKIYQTLETVFHRVSKHLEFVKNTPLRVVFSTLFSVFGYPDETLLLVFDILHQNIFHRRSINPSARQTQRYWIDNEWIMHVALIRYYNFDYSCRIVQKVINDTIKEHLFGPDLTSTDENSPHSPESGDEGI